MDAVREHGADLLPIDSEHNAIFQCLPGGYRCGSAPPGVRRLLLACVALEFTHPATGATVRVQADPGPEFDALRRCVPWAAPTQ